MNLETFEAETMAQALAKVKRRFGKEAVILHTRTFRRGGMLGCGGRQMVEITAAGARGGPTPVAGRRGVLAEPESAAGPTDESRRAMAATEAEPSEDVRWSSVSRELKALRTAVDGLRHGGGQAGHDILPRALHETYQGLIENQVAEDIAFDIVFRLRAELSADELGDPAVLRARLRAYIESMLPACGPIQLRNEAGPTIIALIGPTGVGKTTTAAKLAAHLRLRQNCTVGLISTDGRRLAAAEQMGAYARIIGTPFANVVKPERMSAALESLRNCDVVVVDTEGATPTEGTTFNRLRAFLDRAGPHEVHLVLSSTSSRAVLDRAIEFFGRLNPQRILLTKLDEAVGFGVVLACLRNVETQLSYVTTGPSVPRDIEAMQRSSLADRIVSGCRVTRETIHSPGDS